MNLLRSDEQALSAGNLLKNRRGARVKAVGLLLFATALFLFAPAMQGIGLSAGNREQHPADPAVDVDRAARDAVAKLAARP